MRRPNFGITERTDVGITHVVNEDEDDVGLRRFGFCGVEYDGRREKQTENEEVVFHGRYFSGA
jgi:hypothetical protein